MNPGWLSLSARAAADVVAPLLGCSPEPSGGRRYEVPTESGSATFLLLLGG